MTIQDLMLEHEKSEMTPQEKLSHQYRYLLIRYNEHLRNKEIKPDELLKKSQILFERLNNLSLKILIDKKYIDLLQIFHLTIDEENYLTNRDFMALVEPDGDVDILYNSDCLYSARRKPLLNQDQYKQLTNEEKKLLLVPIINKLLRENIIHNNITVENIINLPSHVKKFLLNRKTAFFIKNRHDLMELFKLKEEYIKIASEKGIYLAKLVQANVVEFEKAAKISDEIIYKVNNRDISDLIFYKYIEFDEVLVLSKIKLKMLEIYVDHILEKKVDIDDIFYYKEYQLEQIINLKNAVPLIDEDILFFAKNHEYFDLKKIKISDLPYIPQENKDYLANELIKRLVLEEKCLSVNYVASDMQQEEFTFINVLDNHFKIRTTDNNALLIDLSITDIINTHRGKDYWYELVDLYKEEKINSSAALFILDDIKNNLLPGDSVYNIKTILTNSPFKFFSKDNLLFFYKNLDDQVESIFNVNSRLKDNLSFLIDEFISQVKVRNNWGKAYRNSKLFKEETENFKRYLSGIKKFIVACNTPEEILDYLERTFRLSHTFSSLGESASFFGVFLEEIILVTKYRLSQDESLVKNYKQHHKPLANN